MKQWIAFFLALVMVLALVGCQKGNLPSNDPASQPNNTRSSEMTTEAQASETDAPAASSEAAATEAPTEAPAATTEAATEPAETSPIETENEDPDASNAYGLVRNQLREVGSYTITFDDDYEQVSSYSFRVPEITEQTAGAASINQKINQRFLGAAQSELAQIEANIGSPLIEMGWYVELWNGLVSLVVYETMDWGTTDYEIYYYDSELGQELNAYQVLDRLVLTEENFLEGVRAAVRERYDQQYANIEEDQRETMGYYAMRDRIDGADLINMSMVKFYVSEGAQISVVAPVPSLAGADYYYQIVYPSFAVG